MARNKDIDKGEESNGYTALHWAAIKGNTKIAEMLVENGAKVDITDTSGQTPLQRATAHGKHNFESANIVKKINNMVWILFYLEQVEMVEFLLKHGANPNAKHDVGRTPLHLAARNGFERIVDALIKYGADVNHGNDYGKTALHKATEKGDNIHIFINSQNDHAIDVF